MLAWLKILFGFASGLFGWLRDRKHDQVLKSQVEAGEDAQILKDIKRAKDITDNKPLADDLLISPDQRGHNED